MTAVSPVLPSNPLVHEIVIARDQKPYAPLPIFRDGEHTLSRWRLTWRERLGVLLGGSVYLWVITPFDKPYPPVRIQVEEPK